jgi:hypothetical protein
MRQLLLVCWQHVCVHTAETHLLEADHVGVEQHPVVEDLALHILVHLRTPIEQAAERPLSPVAAAEVLPRTKTTTM